MNQLQTIKETAFELLMNLHPKHIKVLNNEVLRPLYRMAEARQNTPADIVAHAQNELLVQERNRLADRLEQTESESLAIIRSYQDQLKLTEMQVEGLLAELHTAQSLLESKQRIIDQFMMKKDKISH